jgi:hypothetical protein
MYEREGMNQKGNITSLAISSVTRAVLPEAIICSEELPRYVLYN